MYSDKTLVVLGCSHTYGVFKEDTSDLNSCHNRSWASKLGKLANFKEVVNLSIPGGSNYRSERKLLEYLKTNSKDLVVIFSITELSRFETVNMLSLTKEDIPEKQNDLYGYQSEGSWKLSSEYVSGDERKSEYLKYHYSVLSCSQDDSDIINRKILMIHSLLKTLNLEHYFFTMISNPTDIYTSQLGIELPFITFPNNHNAMNWMTSKFTPGYCGHFDHDANQALAEYLFEQINIIKGNQYER